MKQSNAVMLSVGVALFACLSSGPALAQAKSPTEAYLAFVAAAQKAKSLEEVLPHLSKEYRAMLSAQAKEQKPVWLQRLRDSADMTDIKIGKETVSGEVHARGHGEEQQGVSAQGQGIPGQRGWRLEARRTGLVHLEGGHDDVDAGRRLEGLSLHA